MRKRVELRSLLPGGEPLVVTSFTLPLVCDACSTPLGVGHATGWLDTPRGAFCSSECERARYRQTSDAPDDTRRRSRVARTRPRRAARDQA